MARKQVEDIVMTEAERLMALGEKRARDREQEREREDTVLVRRFFEHLFERRLGRPLDDFEQATMDARAIALGLDRLGQIALESTSAEVEEWFAVQGAQRLADWSPLQSVQLPDDPSQSPCPPSQGANPRVAAEGISKNPHELLFRWAFSDVRRVTALLPKILPPKLAAMVAWDSADGVKAVPVVLDAKDLGEKRPNMVWSLRLHGRSAELYVIVEHQSKSLRHMGWRLLDYANGVWNWWIESHERAAHLPSVVGLVVSNDPAGWTTPTHLWDLRETDPELEAVLGATQPDIDFFLEDLSLRAEEDILGWELDAVGKLTLLLLKYAPRHTDIRSKLRQWVGLFAEAEPWEHAFPRLVGYILSVKDDVTAQELTEDFGKMLGKRAGEIVMTEAKRSREEGRKEGLEQGFEQGRREGRLQGLRDSFETLLACRLGRRLSDPERELLSLRLAKLGPNRLGDAVLRLPSPELLAWLEDPNAK